MSTTTMSKTSAASSHIKNGNSALESPKQPPLVLSSHPIHDQLVQHHRRIDPMEFYTIEAVLGEGSMGFVAKVYKKDFARGGSARPEFVKQYHPVAKVCFCIPSPFALFCPPKHDNDCNNNNRFNRNNGTLIDISPPPPSDDDDNDDGTNSTSILTSSGLSVDEPIIASTTPTTSNDHHKTTTLHYQRQTSSMISYGSKNNNKKTYYALKSIILDQCATPEFKEELKNEVEILKTLDHPNIVRAFETYDYRGRLYMVMELCDGKDLYSRDPYTERDAQHIMTSLFEAISYLHTKGIVHCDLKFENIMFVDETPDAEIRLIDFGLSQKFAVGEHLHAFVGTVYTMAPELIQGDYDEKADIWSLGVIAFMLLSSSMPFFGESREAVIDHITHGKYKFQSPRWQHVSDDAKDFVVSLLRRRPEKRPTALDALHKSAWLTTVDLNASTNTLIDNDRMDTIQASIQAFAGYKTLKKLALLVVAYKSTNEEIGFLRKMFSKFDTSNDGEITYDEFRTALFEHYDYTESEVETMFAGMDIDGLGRVHYMEFLAATIEAHGSIDEERVAESFDRLDADDTGVITVQNLKDFLGDELSDSYLQGVLSEAHNDSNTSTVDDDKEDQSFKNYSQTPAITYDEFLNLWDLKADTDMQSAKQTVNAHRLNHAVSSTLSTISSTRSDDDYDDDNDTAENITDTTTAATARITPTISKQTGCRVFQDEHRKSITKVVATTTTTTTTALYGDV